MPPIPFSDPADEAAARSAAHLALATRSVPVPSPVLGGWESLAAAEYAGAVLRLRRRLELAADAFHAAGGTA